MIWEFTLTPRVIETEFLTERGFYTRVPTPLALKVCKDSREAVERLYPGCFGNNIYEPRILFNFSMDTLYLDSGVQHQTLLLLAGLNEAELKGLRFMAIDDTINENYDISDTTEYDTFELVKKLLPKMPSMQALQIVQNVEDWNELSLPGSLAPMQLFEKWPDMLEVYHSCFEDLDSVNLEDMTEEEIEGLIYTKPFISLSRLPFTPSKPSPALANSPVSIRLDTWRRKHLLNNLIDRRRMTSRTLTVLFHPPVSLPLCFSMIPVASQSSSFNLKDHRIIIPSHALPRYFSSASLLIVPLFSIINCSIHWLELMTSIHSRLPLGQPSLMGNCCP